MVADTVEPYERVYRMKRNGLRSALAEGERDLEEGRYTDLKPEQIAPFLQKIKERPG